MLNTLDVPAWPDIVLAFWSVCAPQNKSCQRAMTPLADTRCHATHAGIRTESTSAGMQVAGLVSAGRWRSPASRRRSTATGSTPVAARRRTSPSRCPGLQQKTAPPAPTISQSHIVQACESTQPTASAAPQYSTVMHACHARIN